MFVKHFVKKMEAGTEKLIKQQTKILYFNKDYFDVSILEIAYFAEVKRASVNYYFRSKKDYFKLFTPKLSPK